MNQNSQKRRAIRDASGKRTEAPAIRRTEISGGGGTLRKRIAVLVLSLLVSAVCSLAAGAAQVTLCWQDGKVYKKMEVTGSERFPGVKLKASTFNGWGIAKTVHKKALYTAGQKIPNRDAVYYMIGNSNSEIRTWSASKMKASKKYSQIFLVGDSRTMQMYLTIRKMLKRTSFVYGNGGGLTWFKNTGYPMLLSRVRAESAKGKKKKSAVVLNLGVNDLRNIRLYIDYYKTIHKELSRYNCELFIMSVNPIDFIRMKDGGRNLAKKATSVLTFNKKLKSGTKGLYTWVDTYAKLMESGWTTQGSVYDGGGDGVHYTKATYQRIYNFLIEEIG